MRQLRPHIFSAPVTALVTALVTAVALVLLPLTTTSAHAADGTITGYARDASGKPLLNIGWEVYYRTGSGEWQTPQFGPKLTDAAGRFSFRSTIGTQYRVCFDDNYAGRADTATGFWQPEERYRDMCWPNATSLSSAQTWTATAAAPSRTFPVTLPKQGLGMAPVDPFILGSYQVNEPLTIIGQEGWRPTNATFTYQWMSRAQGDTGVQAPIPGATSATFTPTSAQNNQWVWASVTATRPGYKPATMITPLTMVGTPRSLPTSPLKITGSATPGNTLTASYSKNPTDYSETTWFVDGVPQPPYDGSSTSSPNQTSTFRIPAAASGARVEARLRMYKTDALGNYVDGSNSFHRVQVSVAGTRPALPLPTPAAPTGQPTLGKVLTAPTQVTADRSAQISYQWMRSAAPITGATAPRYTVRKADLNKRISVRVKVTRPGWWSTYVTTSRATEAKRALKNGRLTVTGTARVGKRLTATTKGWGPKKVTIRHQWLRDGRVIKRATKPRYQLTKKDRRHTIAVRITVKKAGYLTVTHTSKGRTVKR